MVGFLLDCLPANLENWYMARKPLIELVLSEQHGKSVNNLLVQP